MAQILHQRATTTHAIRAEIQRSTDSIAELSRRYNLNPNRAQVAPESVGRGRQDGLDICDIRTGEGRAYLFVAVDRTSTFVHARLYRKANRDQAAAFLEDVVQQLPYPVHTVLTDNGVPFAKRCGTEAYKSHRFSRTPRPAVFTTPRWKSLLRIWRSICGAITVPGRYVP